jgi:sorting nexin-5/6/32
MCSSFMYRCLANYENANKNLDKARARNRDVPQAENAQQEACQRFEHISEKAKEELKTLRVRRVASFQKSLTELAELELKHSKAHAQMLRATIATLKAEL